MSFMLLPGMFKSSRFRNIGLNISLLAGSLLFVFLMLEGGLRLYEYLDKWWESKRSIQPLFFIPDPELGYRLKPSSSGRRASRGEYDMVEHINSMGLRGQREYAPENADAYRILAVGDSFTYGWGVEVEASFLHLLEQRLQNRYPDRKYEVVNAGVPGYGTVQTFYWLKEIASIFNPDLILLNFYIGDDIEQNAEWLRTVSSGDQPEANKYSEPEPSLSAPVQSQYEGRIPVPLKAMLAEYSMAYRFLRERYHRLLITIRIRQQDPQAEPWWLNPYRKDLAPEAEPGYAATEAILTQMAEWATAQETRLMVMLIPDRSQVYPEHWTRTIHDRLTFDRERYDLEKPDRWLVNLGERLGIPVFDLLPLMQNYPRNTLLYYNWDHHWTVDGHRMVADALFNRLIEQDKIILPAEP